MGIKIHYLEQDTLLDTLKRTPSSSQDAVLLITGALDLHNIGEAQSYLDEAIRVLNRNGLLFIQGIPQTLPFFGVYLDTRLRFKYWIAIESETQKTGKGLPSVHAAVLLFCKGERFDIQRVRFSHQYCQACNKPLRDWGGKTHLMHPDGYAISDVWKGLPLADNYANLSQPVLEILLKLAGPTNEIGSTNDVGYFQDFHSDHAARSAIIGPKEGLFGAEHIVTEPKSGYSHQTAIQYVLPGFTHLYPPKSIETHTPVIDQGSFPGWNVVLNGDALKILKQYPDNSVDLVFADPPYNLDKAYSVYDDERDRRTYLDWCNAWLDEYIRILKPSGSLYVLNLPRWGMYHAAYLNSRLYFQNWIVWDALSEPRGKLMPAHYALLFYTKHPTDFTFRYPDVGEIEARFYCLRTSCIRHRKAAGDEIKEPLADIWQDIHRLKHRRDRDYHPCQLPDSLMERIIRLSTNPGDIVLDALAGTGTTAVVAAKLGRRYVAIDIDDAYVNITRTKLAQVELTGQIRRPRVQKQRAPYNKKELQLELRALATRLGRLPTLEDVQQMSKYKVEAYLQTFPTWGKALKAAKIELQTNGNRST